MGQRWTLALSSLHKGRDGTCSAGRAVKQRLCALHGLAGHLLSESWQHEEVCGKEDGAWIVGRNQVPNKCVAGVQRRRHTRRSCWR